MYYYFCSSFPAVLKINGLYYGSIYKTIKPIRLDLDQAPFIEVCSLCEDEQSVNILLDNDFLCSPTHNVSVTDLNGGYVINFNCSYKKAGFEVIKQEKYPNAIVTVFNENGLKISIETPEDFFAQTVCFNAKIVDIAPFSLGKNNFIAISLTLDKTLLLVYKLNNKIERVFERQVESFNTENGLSTTENVFDIAKHKIKCSWEYDGYALKEKNRTVSCGENFSIKNLNENILPYAFLEQLLVGLSIDEFIGDCIKENKQLISDYVGNFIGVMPPPEFLQQDYVGLIYKIKENVFKVKYFKFELKNRKIINIDKIEKPLIVK